MDGARTFPILSFIRKNEILSELRERIDAITKRPEASWGPKLVAVVVETSDGDHVTALYDNQFEWNPGWPSPPEFFDIATAKLRTAQATGCSSREACDQAPFNLPVDGCLWGGAVTAPGIWVAASGLREAVDEEVANLVLDAFLQAALEEVARRRATGDKSEMVLRSKD